jgi:hypothetical protein
LYEDYKKYYQNIPLISDALLTCDLTKSENVSERNIQDTSGNNNTLLEIGPVNINYDGETSVIFNTANKNLLKNLNLKEGNVDFTFSIWLLVNRQTGYLSNRQRIFTLGSGRTASNSSLFLSLFVDSIDSYALQFGSDGLSSSFSPLIIFPDLWYNITCIRSKSGEYKLYVDNTLIFTGSRAEPLNITNILRVGKSANASSDVDFQIGQLGTMNIFERVLELPEIEDLHYLYNVRYLLKNSHVNCRISENFNPLSPNKIPFRNHDYKIISSAFRFDNFTRLTSTSEDDFDFFDGKSFDTSRDNMDARFFRRLINNIPVFATNTKFSHSFNGWIKLNQDASGPQHILGYGTAFSSKSKVLFILNQVGDTNKFIPNIKALMDDPYPGYIAVEQNIILPEIETDSWYFFSFNRDTINKVINVSINGEPFITQSYIDEMNVRLDYVYLSLGGLGVISSNYIQQSRIGNYSLFNRPLSIREVK